MNILSPAGGVRASTTNDIPRFLHIGNPAFAIECLAIAIPVMAVIRDNLLNLDPPVIPVTEATLRESLEDLVRHSGRRREVRLQQFRKAREIHSPERVAEKVPHSIEQYYEDRNGGDVHRSRPSAAQPS